MTTTKLVKLALIILLLTTMVTSYGGKCPKNTESGSSSSWTVVSFNYYVAKNGNDNNDGSEKSPFLTISKAAQVAMAGDTVYIRAGTYDETVTPPHSGEAGKLITFTNYSGENVMVRGIDAYGFYLNDVNYIKINGLMIIRGLGAGVQTIPEYRPYKSSHVAHGAGIKLFTADHNVITNNDIYDNDIGIFVSTSIDDDNMDNFAPSLHNEIMNNKIHHNGETGIRIKRSDYTTIGSNIIYNNGLVTNNVYAEPAAGITYYGSIGTIIANNTIYGNSNLAVDNYAGTDSLTCDSEDTVIKNNILSQTNPSPIQGRIYTGKKIVLSIADKEIFDSSHVYRYNTFYNGESNSEIIAWGTNNLGDKGVLLTFNEFMEQSQALNPDSVGNEQVAVNPIIP